MKKLQKQIFLIGFMGCGKSTYGKELSQLLNFPFFDLDAEIEAASGKTIPDIFSESGESYFRELEAAHLKKFTKQNSPFVLATGGGTPCYFNNLQLMQQNGPVVYLKLTPEKLHSRLKHQQQQRPLIASLNKDELLQYILQTLNARSRFYNLADVVIDPASFKPIHLCKLFL